MWTTSRVVALVFTVIEVLLLIRFTGKLHKVVVDLEGAEPPRDLRQEATIEMARQ